MKRFIPKSMMVALGVLLSLNAHAYDTYINGIYYNLVPKGKVAEVTSGKVKYKGDVEIPSSFEKNGITYSVTSIGSFAFQDCNGLTSVTIPNSVTKIDGCAFWGCYGLTSVTIPNSVTTIGQSAFYGTAWYINQPNGLVYAGNIAYEYKGTMPENTSVTIKNGTTSISDRAFENCSGLTSVTIPNSVTSIGNQAFYGCYGLTSVTIPNSVTSIGNLAFYGCSGLTSVTIPNSVTTIGESAFYGTAFFNNQEDGLVYVGKVAYQYKGTMPENTSITIKNGTTSISGYAFYNCSGLTSVTIPNSVTSIGFSAFYGCYGLTSVTIPNSVTSIGDLAFEGCRGLTSVTIPSSVTNIGDYAFEGCRGLTSVTIPSSVTNIGDYAFEGCRGLTSVTIPNSVTYIGYRAFEETAWYNNQPDGLVYAGNIAYKYKGTMPENTSITIKEGTTSISKSAFSGCSGLTSVTIPNSLTSISNYAFQNCSGLTSLTIPNSVTEFGVFAFSGCSGLTSVISEKEEPFSFFYNISSICTLTVPYGTTDAYIAAGWTEDVFKGGIVEAPYNPASDNYLSIVDADAYIGRALTLPVAMNNTANITAFQFEVSLPNGITLSKCELTERKANQTISFSKLPSGKYQVATLSLSSEAFSGTEGALVNLTLDVDEGMEAGEYPVSIENIELTTTGGTAINPADVTATLTVSDVLVADTNGDGKISITDAVAIVNYILGNASASFVSAAADVNGDGRISITDAVAIVNMILGGGTAGNTTTWKNGQDVTDQLKWKATTGPQEDIDNPVWQGFSYKDSDTRWEFRDGEGGERDDYIGWGVYNVATWNVYQSFEIPAGVYTLKLAGAYREGSTNPTFNKWQAGEKTQNAFLYATVGETTYETPLMYMYAGEQKEPLFIYDGWQNDHHFTNGSGQEIYGPSHHWGADKYLENGNWNWNEVDFIVPEKTTIRVGIDKRVEQSQDQVWWNEWRMVYKHPYYSNAKARMSLEDWFDPQ